MKILLENEDRIYIRVFKNAKKYGEHYGITVLSEETNFMELSGEDAFNLGLLPKELEENYYGNASIFEYLAAHRYDLTMEKTDDSIEYELFNLDIRHDKNGKLVHDRFTFNNAKELTNHLQEAANNYFGDGSGFQK